jgi:hypothetical protein
MGLILPHLYQMKVRQTFDHFFCPWSPPLGPPKYKVKKQFKKNLNFLGLHHGSLSKKTLIKMHQPGGGWVDERLERNRRERDRESIVVIIF